MRCSHNAKIWLAYFGSADNASSTFKIRMMSCRNVCLALIRKWKALQSRLAGLAVLAILPTGYGNSSSSVLFGKAIRPGARMRVLWWFRRSTASWVLSVNVNELTELGLSVVHLKDWTGHSLDIEHSPETFRWCRQTCHRSCMILWRNKSPLCQMPDRC